MLVFQASFIKIPQIITHFQIGVYKFRVIFFAMISFQLSLHVSFHTCLKPWLVCVDIFGCTLYTIMTSCSENVFNFQIYISYIRVIKLNDLCSSRCTLQVMLAIEHVIYQPSCLCVEVWPGSSEFLCLLWGKKRTTMILLTFEAKSPTELNIAGRALEIDVYEFVPGISPGARRGSQYIETPHTQQCHSKDSLTLKPRMRFYGRASLMNSVEEIHYHLYQTHNWFSLRPAQISILTINQNRVLPNCFNFRTAKNIPANLFCDLLNCLCEKDKSL